MEPLAEAAPAVGHDKLMGMRRVILLVLLEAVLALFRALLIGNSCGMVLADWLRRAAFYHCSKHSGGEILVNRHATPVYNLYAIFRERILMIQQGELSAIRNRFPV